MRKKKKEKKNEIMKTIGMLLIGFAAIDFFASYAGTNLTPFLGDFSRFSPIIIGLIGAALMRSWDTVGVEHYVQRTEKICVKLGEEE